MRFRMKEFSEETGLHIGRQGVLLYLTETDGYSMQCGAESGRTCMKISKTACPHWKWAVLDFLEYHEEMGREVVLSIQERDLQEARQAYRGHSHAEKRLREGEPAVLVHSTPVSYWESIRSDGCLKSWNLLKAERPDWEAAPIGRLLGDPEDFCDYVMLSDGSVSGEIVGLSKQKGTILMEEEITYETGMRLYFDAERMARDGLLVRNGGHLKVKDRLPLDPYLLWAGDWKRAGLPSSVSTPRAFTAACNDRFRHLFQKPLAAE